MGNRKKTVQEKRDRFLAKIKGDLNLEVNKEIERTTITAPLSERVVLKTVPAVIHWSEWDHNERTDDEIVGETVIYTDGQFDMIINGDVSEEAKSVLNFLQSKNPGNFSLEPREK